MAIVNLGNFPLIIGGATQAYTPFAFDTTLAYLIAGQFAVADFDAIFSRVRLRFLLQITPTFSFYHPEVQTLDILPGVVSFWIPMSGLFLNNGTCTIEATRLSNRYGGADNAPVIGLTLFYEDTITVPSWRN